MPGNWTCPWNRTWRGTGCKAIIALDAHQPEVIGQVADIAGAREKLAVLGIQVLDRLPGLD